MTSPIPTELIALLLVFSPGFLVWSGFFVLRSAADRAEGRRPKFLDVIGWERDYPHFLRMMGWLCLGIGALYIVLLLSAINVGLTPLGALPSLGNVILLVVGLACVGASAVSFRASKRTSGSKSERLNLLGWVLLLMPFVIVGAYQFARDGLPFVD